MWDQGIQGGRNRFPNFNKELAQVDEYLEENEAKILLYKFLYSNVTFAIDLIMGVQIFPFQHIAIKAMLETDYFMGVWSRGSSKSFSTGIFAAFHAIMNQGVQIGIISKTFRQSKMIFKKIEDIAKNSDASLLKQCITKVAKNSDEWVMEIGRSRISALPLGDGEKLRGFRFHCVIIDEFLLMPEKIFNEVILPFLAVTDNPQERKQLEEAEDELIRLGKMDVKDRHIWTNNKLITLSSASYKFEYMYKVYSEYESLITGNTAARDKVAEMTKTIDLDDLDDDKEMDSNAHRTIMHISYACIPKQLYDQNLLKQGRATMSDAQFDREFNSVFTDDSSGYFKISKMAACTYPEGEGEHFEIKGDPKCEYIASFDPSWAENESSDDWALQVFKLDKASGRRTLVHSYAVPGAKLKAHVAYFYYILTNFNIVMVIGDKMGGEIFVQACNDSSLFKAANIKLGVISSKFLDDKKQHVRAMRDLRNQYNKSSRKFVILRSPTSNWIREANELLQTSIDRRRIRFASTPTDNAWRSAVDKSIPIANFEFKIQKEEDKGLNDCDGKEEGGSLRAKKIEFLEHIADMAMLTKAQCSLIQPTTSSTGQQRFDLPATLRKQTGPNKTRKDSYSAIVLGNWGTDVYYDMMKPAAKFNTGFTPFGIS
tara:strand:- start:11380 stop:13344 length:1965 start_codon:yes stop_codon:yes gene_type:complete